MTKEQALGLQPGDCVIAHKSNRLTPPKSLDPYWGQVLTVVQIEEWEEDVLVCVDGCGTALFHDELDFAESAYAIDEDLDENMAGSICDLLGGGIL